MNVSGVIASRGDNIQYVHTDSNHTDPLHRITPARLITTQEYDKEKYLDILLDSAESVHQYLDLIGHYLVLTKRKTIIGGMRYTSNVRKTFNQQKLSYNIGDYL